MTDKEKKAQCNLWDDFLDLGDKHQDDLTIQAFAHNLIMFTAKMCADTAPSLQEVKALFDCATNMGIEWSRKEHENQTGGEHGTGN